VAGGDGGVGIVRAARRMVVVMSYVELRFQGLGVVTAGILW
jgi:hypothetical protein